MTDKSNEQSTDSPFALSDEALENALLSGEQGTQLERYFGEAAYQELRDLALRAGRNDVRGGDRVLLLPGIMGSTLGVKGRIRSDTLWIDPVDIVRGNLTDLAIPDGNTKVRALGVVQFSYLKLKLSLRIAGFDVAYHPFDWRQDLLKLGRELAKRIIEDPADELRLVAHSMGGLVARAALAQGGAALDDKLRMLIMLGTPNSGSFVPVQALRGVYPVVRKVAALDLAHSAEELAEEVFNTFPGLYQMLPFASVWSDHNLYDLSSWPVDGPRPRAEMLRQAQASQQALAPADERFKLIAGVNQQTITNLSLTNGRFVYESSADGDGTVPLSFAMLSGMDTWYVEESHGSLPNNGAVGEAVRDLLRDGDSERLPKEPPAAARGMQRQLQEADLPRSVFDGRSGDEVRESEVRQLLRELVAPPADAVVDTTVFVDSDTETTNAGFGPVDSKYAHAFDQVVVGRRRQHRVDVRLALGSIEQVDASAYVLGMYRDVDPGGAAKALNNQLDGMITDFTTRRIFAGNVGEVFLLPTGRHPIRCNMILFAGMGAFDRFNRESAQLVAENVVRTFVRTRIDEFATVLMGSGSGEVTAEALRNLLVGFFRGLLDTDEGHNFRSITLCERDPLRYLAIKQELFRLASTPLFRDIEVTFDEIRLPPMVTPAYEVPRHLKNIPNPAYLIVREEGCDDKALCFRSSVLTAGAKATVVTSMVKVSRKELDARLRKIETTGFSFAALSKYGAGLTSLILGKDVVAVLEGMEDRRLVVVHDAPSSRIPWETLYLAGRFPALETGMSRRYLADNLSVAKWLEQRRHGEELDVLLVINPTGDLDGAEVEGKRVAELFGANSRVRLHRMRGEQATKKKLATAFSSGQYDIVHYAGHAYFDPENPARSGIICAGKERLRGEELASLGNLPTLVFFNACEAARLRKAQDHKNPSIQKRIETNVGLAEAFLRGGVANYVGTYWPVGDAPAKTFAEHFYMRLLEGRPIGDALLEARGEVAALKSVDWADYIHYGNPRFVLKGAKRS